MSTPLRSLHRPNWKLENVFFSISTDFSQISIFYFYGSGIGLILLFLQFTCLQPHLLLNQIGFVKSVNLKIFHATAIISHYAQALGLADCGNQNIVTEFVQISTIQRSGTCYRGRVSAGRVSRLRAAVTNW